MPRTIEELVSAGYRRTSNKYGLVSRIDRPDWVEVLADHLGRSPAELYVRGCWADYYRRVLSNDTLELGPVEGRKVPTSNWDTTGYCEKEPEEQDC